MLKTIIRPPSSTLTCSQPIRRSYLSIPPKNPIYRALPASDVLVSYLADVDIDEFRQRAFVPQKPILITTRSPTIPDSATSQTARLLGLGIPAAQKWFCPRRQDGSNGDGAGAPCAVVPSRTYLEPFQEAVLPYELIVNTKDEYIPDTGWPPLGDGVRPVTAPVIDRSLGTKFHRFRAPLQLFLETCGWTLPPKQLYIAQAQIADLPKQLQDDLPTPRIVTEAKLGDVYDANIWMGIPPTYTPLHKDPNPNLFVQLASTKLVRLVPPSIGGQLFREVQEKTGQRGPSSLRGDEMMDGPERDALDEAVWGTDVTEDGVGTGIEVIVRPGEALFIPNGWWHSIKSVGTDVTASVNWWFR
ncbi:uncharacterized protein BP5553_02009 [Venustampulla echinocandica]|uniref:JmjC domain-containing protein n=1 Tax=Venustampulla echinocandica TaxID=2656787 RepID=A0A370U2M5_9HELO|nr:uncharacterized protein BP5553_02009 [Venustampulla echinocandica]RDL42030.1 hypothetical protein BP5553_02009 [Venustampulla echinocandica]